MRTARRRRRRSAWRQRAGGRAGDRGGSGPRAGRRRAESWRDGGRRDLPRAGPSCQAEGRPRSAPAQRPGRRQLAGRGRDDARALEDSNSQHSPGRVEPREGKPAPLRIRDPGGEMGSPLPPPRSFPPAGGVQRDGPKEAAASPKVVPGKGAGASASPGLSLAPLWLVKGGGGGGGFSGLGLTRQDCLCPSFGFISSLFCFGQVVYSEYK